MSNEKTLTSDQVKTLTAILWGKHISRDAMKLSESIVLSLNKAGFEITQIPQPKEQI